MSYSFFNRQIATSLYQALQADSFYATMEKSISTDKAKAQEGMYQYLDFSMKEAKKFGKLYLSPENSNYGASVWSGPLSSTQSAQKTQEKHQFIQEHLGTESLQVYQQIVTAMEKNTQGLIPERTWYLSILGIDPSMQGKGLGGILLKDCLADLDQQGCASYLETFTPQNMNFYKRLGYEEVGEFFEETTHSNYWVMLRNPQN